MEINERDEIKLMIPSKLSKTIRPALIQSRVCVFHLSQLENLENSRRMYLYAF